MHYICYKNRWTITGLVPNLMTTFILKCEHLNLIIPYSSALFFVYVSELFWGTLLSSHHLQQVTIWEAQRCSPADTRALSPSAAGTGFPLLTRSTVYKNAVEFPEAVNQIVDPATLIYS